MLNSKLSYKACELLHMKRVCIKELRTLKKGHQDVKKLHEISFAERINIQCNAETNKLIRKHIVSNERPLLLFQLSSPSTIDRSNKTQVSKEMTKEGICTQLAAPYLVKKLHISLLEEVDCAFRKLVIKMLQDVMNAYLSKSFTNLTRTVH